MDYSQGFKIIIAGSGPDVGKTLTAAIVATALQAEYWKPVQCGTEDTATILALAPQIRIHPTCYTLQHPLSPHHAARLEGITIQPSCIKLPMTTRPLVIETSGGLLSPWNLDTLPVDIIKHWKGIWIVVSRHYLGSINHTLLTIEALKQRQCCIGGVIFNGWPNEDTQEAILQFSQLPCLGQLYPEKEISPQIIKEYAKRWKPQLEARLF